MTDQKHSGTPPLAQERKEGKETKSRQAPIFESEEAEAEEEIDYVDEQDLVIQELFLVKKLPLVHLRLYVPHDLWTEYAGRTYLSSLSELQQLVQRWGGEYEYEDNQQGCRVKISCVKISSIPWRGFIHHPRGTYCYKNAQPSESELDEGDAVVAGSRARRSAIEQSDDDSDAA